MGNACSCIERKDQDQKTKASSTKKQIKQQDEQSVRSEKPKNQPQTRMSFLSPNLPSTLASLDLSEIILDCQSDILLQKISPTIKILSPTEQSLINQQFPIRAQSEAFQDLSIQNLLNIVFSQQEVFQQIPIQDRRFPQIQTIGSKVCHKIISILNQGADMKKFHNDLQIHQKLLKNLETFHLNLLIWSLAVLDKVISTSVQQNLSLYHLNSLYFTPQVLANLNNLLFIKNEYSKYWLVKFVVSLVKLSQQNVKFLMGFNDGRIIRNCVRTFSAFSSGGMFYQFSLILKELLLALPLSEAYNFTGLLKLHVTRRSRQLASPRVGQMQFQGPDSSRHLATTKLLGQIRSFCEQMTYIKETKVGIADEEMIQEFNRELNSLQRLPIETLVENVNLSEKLSFELKVPQIGCLKTKGAFSVFQILRLIRENEEVVEKLGEVVKEKMYLNIGVGLADLENSSVVLLEKIGEFQEFFSDDQKESLIEKLIPLFQSPHQKVKFSAFSLILRCYQNKSFSFHVDKPYEFQKMFLALKDYSNAQLFCKHIVSLKQVLKQEEGALNLLREQNQDWEDILQDSSGLISVYPEYCLFQDPIEESKKELIELFSLHQ